MRMITCGSRALLTASRALKAILLRKNKLNRIIFMCFVFVLLFVGRCEVNGDLSDSHLLNYSYAVHCWP